jgi:single-strand DNA-binding protein
LSYLPSGTPVCEFGLAVNRKWKGQDGQLKEDVCFVDCRCFQRGAENINQYMTKGRPILIEGHLRLDQWENKEGQKRSKLYVVVDNFQFLGARGEGGDGRGRAGRPAAEGAAVEEEPMSAAAGDAGDEIPF